MVPPGALVTLVQKGLQYLEMEANLNNNDADVDEDFSFLQPLDLLTKDVYQLRQIVKEKKKNQQKAVEELAKEQEKQTALAIERDKQSMEKESEKEKERVDKDKQREKKHEDLADREILVDQQDNVNIKLEENGTFGGPEPMDISISVTPQASGIPSSDVMILEGHTSEVCACAWSPAGSLLASGSGDSTARIWNIADRTNRSSLQNGPANVLVLKHVKGKANDKGKDVTTLDWNVSAIASSATVSLSCCRAKKWFAEPKSEGTLLATGSYDGQARIWNTNGELKSTLSKHKGPIFSIKWNKKGDYLLTGSFDETAIVWDVKADEWKQQFKFHSGGPTLDVDWRNNHSFASSSTDNMIYVCKIGENRPIKLFSGHKGEVNCVKWDPTGSLLASCSDDITAKIWSMKHDKHIHDLREHAKEIYTIRWSPSGPGTNNPNQQLLLASASFDSTVKLWDVEHGRLVRSLNGHRDAVYALSFSPNGEYLASGSLDRCMHVWSLKEGKIIKTYSGNGSIFEVCWNKEGDKIAACTNNNTVCVLDFRM
ncbi:hypothetical protein OSB04_027112 [Centaurea solstitialis]|uniref:Uncharacterized protein n=1 Tax=Centaurea solstitialis TaxID=347529 RepID=A0AA38W9X6_9ASTR|nr:hypothetical protein OSB04_027112 [Centaurea solstitialis]